MIFAYLQIPCRHMDVVHFVSTHGNISFANDPRKSSFGAGPQNECCVDLCGRITGHFTSHRMVGCNLLCSSILLDFVSSDCSHMDGKVHDRCHGISLCGHERTLALWIYALRAYEGKTSQLIPWGSTSKVGTTRLNWSSSAYNPNLDLLAFRRSESSVLRVDAGHQAVTTGEDTAA